MSDTGQEAETFLKFYQVNKNNPFLKGHCSLDDINLIFVPCLTMEIFQYILNPPFQGKRCESGSLLLLEILHF